VSAFDDWRLMGSMLSARDEHARWRAGHYPEDHGEPHMMAVEDDEPRPDAIGPTPTWFLIMFVIGVMCCGFSALAGLALWIAGAFS